MPSDVRIIEGRYELRTRLGEGGMGQVWQSYDRELRRSVALKLIHPHRVAPGTNVAELEELVERFRREARIIARFHHPGIPVLYDAKLNRDAGTLYMVMELVLGEDLTQVITRNGRLPTGQVVSIGAQICDILAHTHADPVVHRDLKPGNIMLAGNGMVKLLDFGVAAVFGSAHRKLTSSKRVLGTVSYMAPEQFDAGSLVTPRCDLYSLGCVLYHLLAGEPPFTAESPLQLMRDHHDRPPVPLRWLRPELDSVLDALVLELLAKRPDDRPASARDVYDRLRPFIDNSEAVSPPPQRNGCVPCTPTIRDTDTDTHTDVPASEPLPVRLRIVQALALFDDGRYGHALPAYVALADELEAAGSDHADGAIECRNKAAYCRMRLGDGTGALKEFQALSDQLRAVRPSTDVLLLEVRRHIGLLLHSAGRIRDAVEELADLYPLLVETVGKDAPETAEVRGALNRIRTQP